MKIVCIGAGYVGVSYLSVKFVCAVHCVDTVSGICICCIGPHLRFCICLGKSSS